MPINIDYTTIDFDALKSEVIAYLKETNTFKDIDFVSSNINTLVQMYAYLGSLFGYYINSIANEPFLPSAKRYKNLNRIARLLNYKPRGDGAASVDVVGSLLPEYCFGKEGVYFQIPAYSSFPSNKQTPGGQSFSFANPLQTVYLIRSYGVRPVQQPDFTYDNLSFPITAPASYWGVSSSGSSGTPSFDPAKIQLILSDTKPLSILDRLDPTHYRHFDVATAPLYNGADSSPAGQPFNRNIPTKGTSLRILPATIYYIVFNYDIQTATPYLTLMEEGPRLTERKDDVIMSVRLDKNDAAGNFYTLQQVNNNAAGRFHVGVLGVLNLDSVSFAFDKLENTTNGIKQVHIDINKSGDKAPFTVLVDGVVYTFKQGRISSQVFDNNSWDTNQPTFNINLNIVTPDAPDFNYDATLTVTSDPPGINEVTVAQIFTNFVDTNTGIRALQKDPGQRFGNLQALPEVDITTTEQKTGFVNFPAGTNKLFVVFDTPFSTSTSGEAVDYIIELTPENNVQLWYSDQTEEGFAINVEQEAGFTGRVNWLATRFKQDLIQSTPVLFTTPIPQIDAGFDTEYTVFLSSSDNVRVWYEDKTPQGFRIVTEKDFNGTVSYSTFVASSNEQVIAEKDASTQKKGRVTLTADILTQDIKFDIAFPDDTYGLHMIANKNFNTWYTNKTGSGFTINIEPGFDSQVSVEWFADQSPSYQFQKHGMISFSGQLNNGALPGVRFANIAETFQIQDLKQGNIKFGYINKNGAIDVSNNSLNLQFSIDRKSPNEIKVYSNQTGTSFTDMRVFVKNEVGDWEEWKDATSETASVSIDPGNKVFFVRVNEYQHVEITFGDGLVFGKDPYGSDIIIFGLSTVGQDGNIPPNTLSPSVVLSENILGDDNITIQFEQQFIQLVGLKTDVFSAAGASTSPTALYDSEGTQLTQKELAIIQPSPAFGGVFVETVEELRSNAGMANLRQDRIVSLDDYKSFCDQFFSTYIIKTQVLSYKDLQDSGLLQPFELAKYWFNFIFIVALPKFGNTIEKVQRDFILTTLDKRFKAMATVEHELLSAKLIPIDVRVLYQITNIGNPATIESQIKTGIRSFFDRSKHELGETLEVSQIQKIVLDIPGVNSAEVAINRNDNNVLSPADYKNDAIVSANQTVEQVKRQKILEILAKDPSILGIIDPLFTTTDQNGKREWSFTGDIKFGKFEFPDLGNIVIEQEST